MDRSRECCSDGTGRPNTGTTSRLVEKRFGGTIVALLLPRTRVEGTQGINLITNGVTGGSFGCRMASSTVVGAKK